MAQHDLLTPLYEQVRRTILADIQSGRLAEGDFLPPEPELCTAHGVSRITLRRAIGELCAEGRLIRQQGRGTVVAPRKVNQRLVSLSGFSETMDGLGLTSSHRILECEDASDDTGIATRLRATSPIRFLRLLEVDGRPMTLETLWFDAVRYPEAVTSVAQGGSFFAALRDTARVSPVSAERQINVGFATSEEREIFGITASQPMYRIEKTTFGQDGVVLGLSELVTPCHLVSFHLET
ncbi:MAG: GntR family transcriptional regulator [Cereibacter sphaeroides]|uniref:GntR family transcriptional regulator n=1 Tax=Cereibacter sphaeroides TaxID=1063 RepID=A0A2W5S1Y5_CERSP|nr:MAG: GntR family transcriptional regulator [Cereibacter sphaeroides]